MSRSRHSLRGASAPRGPRRACRWCWEGTPLSLLRNARGLRSAIGAFEDVDHLRVDVLVAQEDAQPQGFHESHHPLRRRHGATQGGERKREGG